MKNGDQSQAGSRVSVNIQLVFFLFFCFDKDSANMESRAQGRKKKHHTLSNASLSLGQEEVYIWRKQEDDGSK